VIRDDDGASKTAPDRPALDEPAPDRTTAYRLPDDLGAAIAPARPRLGRLGSAILFCPTIGSTNDLALTLAAEGDCEGAVVIAEEQTAGRGRRGRAWFSPPGSGLYVSVVLTPARARVDPERATTLLTLAAGVALSEAIEAATGLRVDIKWPNDLLVSRRKLAGILAEVAPASAGVDAIVLGYGINVASTAYPRELGDRATSLETELGRAVDRTALCVETLAFLARRYADLLDGRFDAILDAWRARAPGSRGARVTWQAASAPQAGVTAGIDDDGALLVRVGDRIERIVAGELSWL
jgi:BirA family biotin operon repressor/biotin-[acetyl-CoA-carboxylase] ligase